MKLLLYSINYYPEITGIGKYNTELGKILVKGGHEVDVLCAPPYYPDWRIDKRYKSAWFICEMIDGVIVRRCPLYVPKKVTTVRRLLHLLSFSVSSGVRLLSLIRQKYDVVILTQPTLLCAPLSSFFCFITGSKSVLHIQDYEIDAMLGLGLFIDNSAINLIRSFEAFLMSKFDLVSTISHSMLHKAQQKGIDCSKLLFFPNWADVGFVTPSANSSQIRRKFGLKKNDKVVLYSGNMGKKQGLEIVLDAAESFKQNADVKFLMVGTGAHVDVLKKIAAHKCLNNVLFFPLQAWKDVPAMLTLADVHLVIQKRGAADAVLPSKLTNILAAGGYAIVTAEIGTELGHLSKSYPGIYRLVEPESASELVYALKRELSLSKKGFNKIARQYAVDNLDKQNIISRFEEQIRKKLNLTEK